MSESNRLPESPDNITQRIAALDDKLKGRIPDEVRAEIVAIGQFTLDIAKRQKVLEAHFQLCFEQMNASQEARRRALAALLADGKPLGVATEATEKTSRN
ncbi:MAG: hypothetical protein V1880_01990 [Patescibacteria group bacterium]